MKKQLGKFREMSETIKHYVNNSVTPKDGTIIDYRQIGHADKIF